MTKIYQGNLPQKINVIIDKKVYTTAVFTDGVYNTDDEKIIKELKEYGYKVEETEKPRSKKNKGLE